MIDRASKIAFRLLPALALGTAVLVSPVASAHILRTDGSMSAELHVEPDDAPVTNVPVTYRISFYENDGTFSLKDCNCSVDITTGGERTARQNLNATTDTVSENTITFRKPGTYTFNVTGTPKAAGAFAPFTLSYQERVGTTASTQTTSPLVLGFILAGSTAVIGYAVVLVIRRLKQRAID